MSNTTTVFFLGITGYIGGALALQLRKSYPSYEITAWIRSASAAPAIENLGFKTLIATGDTTKDLQLFADAASQSDIVLNTADADDLPLTQAILAGLKRTTRGPALPILIHTSGTSVIADKPLGEFQETAKKIWDDANPEDIRSIGKDQLHREIDLAIIEGGKEQYFIGYVLAPATIYGVAFDNPGKKVSHQIPALIRTALKKRQAVFGGAGTNLWNNVQIYDLVDLYLIILEKSLVLRSSGLPPPTADDPFTRFYFGSAREHIWGEVVRALAPILHKRGLVDSPEAISVPPGEVIPAVVTNSHSASNRGFKDGWSPKRATLIESLEEDVEGVLATLK